MKTFVFMCALVQTIHFGASDDNINTDSQEDGMFSALWKKIRDLEERDREFYRKCGETEILKARLADAEKQLTNMQELEYRLRNAEEQIRMLVSRVENKNVNNPSTLEDVNVISSHATINSSSAIWVGSDVSSRDSRHTEIDDTLLENVSFKNRIQTAFKVTDLRKIKRTLTRKVAFTAMFSSFPVSVNPGMTLHFDKVDYNQGNAYDAKTGIFTCPVSGTYFFFTNILSMPLDEYIETEIVLRGQTKGSTHAYNAHSNAQGSTAASLHCDAGEMVWVKVVYGHQTYGAALSSFTGFLLWPDDTVTDGN